MRAVKTVELDWSEVKGRFIDSVRHGKRWSQAQQGTLRALHRAPYARDSWQGGSGADTLEWLDNGYFSDELQATPEIPSAERVRVGWSEEDGDIDVGRLFGGYDDFYLEVSPSDTKPGLRIVADMFFAWSVERPVLDAYGAWLCGLISALESNGYDLTVDLRLAIDNLCGEKHRDGSTDVLVKVKKPGELSDFTEWSASFAPTALRHLFFTAFGVAADKLGKQQSSHMASARPKRDWFLSYDEETNTLDISVKPVRTAECPVEMLNEMLTESGLI